MSELTNIAALEYLKEYDPAVGEAMDKELKRQRRNLELIASDEYDVISIHTFDYDNAAHAFGPESKQALNAVSLEAEGFHRIAEALSVHKDKHHTLLTYSPDHGQHPVLGGTGQHGSKQIEDMNIVHFYATI